ncbi:MAG: hypothetical protein EOP82_10220 [Variovorax sp.]|nr:MAG: hypothetical protein EOP82_10220 [Variovorax sp.]
MAPDSAAAAALGPAAAIFPALKGILGEALRLRDRAALQSALMQATPQIRILIQSLRDDVDRLYAVRRAYAELELTGIKNAIDRNLTPAFRMRARHAQPTDAVVVSTLGLLEQRFNDVFNAPEPSPGSRLSSISPATTAGDTPLDGSGVELIDRQLRAANANVVEFKAAVVQFNRSVDALARYDSLLAAVDDAFTKLVSASNNPFATGGGTEQLIHSLVTIRDQARDIKQLLAAR